MDKKSVFIQIILDSFSWKVFDEKYFDSIETLLMKGITESDGWDPLEIISILDSVEEVKKIVERFKKNVVSRKDVPFTDYTDSLSPESEIVQTICHIYEAELSLFDEKKSHYEIQALRDDLVKQKNTLRTLLDKSEYKTDSNDIIETFSEYIEFSREKTEIDYKDGSSQINISHKYHEPYKLLFLVDQCLDPKWDSRIIDEFKSRISEYYKCEQSIWKNLIDWFTAWTIRKATFIDLYILFGYIKNHKYTQDSHLSAYLELKNAFDLFFSTHIIPDDKSPIERRIYTTNRIFFLNYLISTLASALVHDSSILKSSQKEIEDHIDAIYKLAKNYKDGHSYFTLYKLARLYLSASSYYLKDYNKNKKLIEDCINFSKEYVYKAMEAYNLPWGSLLRFYPDYEIIRASKVFSLSWFCRSHWWNFNSRILRLEFDIIEGISKVSQYQIKNDNEAHIAQQIENSKTSIKTEIDDSEKRISRNNIETLSIFSAVVMFVSGNIQIYQYIGSIKAAIIFMLGLGACLTFFVILLRKERDDWLTTITSIIMIFVSLYIWIWPDYEQFNKAYIDSFKEQIFNDLKDKKDMPLNVQKAVENYNKSNP